MSNLFTPEAIEAASAETERLCRELDITNADHIALWLESWLEDDCSVAFLACRIIEAHERELAAIHLDATNWESTAYGCKTKIDELHADRDRASDACASVQKERDELREMLGEAVATIRLGVEYDDLLLRYKGPHAILFDGDVAEIDAAYDKWVSAQRAFLSRYEGEVK